MAAKTNGTGIDTERNYVIVTLYVYLPSFFVVAVVADAVTSERVINSSSSSSSQADNGILQA